jgi:hypothetical protein
MKRFVVRPGAPLALLVALALPACVGEGLLNSGGNPDAVFLTQKSPPGNVMEALYTGQVNRDPQGCLRAESMGGAVVIWPYGFELRSRSGGLYVEDEKGRTIGRIGGDFRMGGGYVDAGSSDTYLSAADRTRAAACPTGSYWIVGNTD